MKSKNQRTVVVTLQAPGTPDVNVELDVRVWKAAKRHAADLGETIDEYLEDALKRFIAKHGSKLPRANGVVHA